jgi:hypothetical protein
MYDTIGKKLAQKNTHASSLDFLRFGESVTETFDIERLQALSKDKRGDAWRSISVRWPNDA